MRPESPVSQTAVCLCLVLPGFQLVYLAVLDAVVYVELSLSAHDKQGRQVGESTLYFHLCLVLHCLRMKASQNVC